MSETAAQRLAGFDSLPVNEQHEVLIALLRRCGELPQRSLTDEELVAVADEAFQAMDAEESDAERTDVR